MTSEGQQNARLEEQLDGARRDLRETLSAVEAKVEHEVERAEVAFSPQKLLRENLVGAACMVGLLGFLIGSGRYRKVAGAAIVVALGYSIWRGIDNQRSDGDDGESINS